MFNSCCVLFYSRCPDWKAKLLTVSTDGDRNMIGSVRGHATQLEHVAIPELVRIWQGSHLDLVPQGFKA
jgi:hypothetical protein